MRRAPSRHLDVLQHQKLLNRLVGDLKDVLSKLGTDQIAIDNAVEVVTSGSAVDFRVRVNAERELNIKLLRRGPDVYVRIDGLGFSKRLKYQMPPDPRPPRGSE